MRTSLSRSPGRIVLLLSLSAAGLTPLACFHHTPLGAEPTGGAGTSGSSGDSMADGAVAGPDVIADDRPHKRIAFNGIVGRGAPGGYNGNLGGLAGADAKCQASADYEELGGAWIAWLSDSTTNALDRVTSDGPWYTLDGHLAFSHKSELAGKPRAVILIDQAEGHVAASSYWTGTRLGGTNDAPNCLNWTSSSDLDEGLWGNGGSLDDWTAAKHPGSCLVALNLLCLEL